MKFPFQQLPTKTAKVAEDSIGLRVVTSLMSLTGALAVFNVIETSEPALIILSMVGIVVGSIFSYYRRRSNNFWVAVAISWGILLIAGFFFRDLVMRVQASISDARIPLTNMLVSLQALHCFDLPRRRDLNLSAIVGLALIASTSTLSRSNDFGIYVVVYMLLGAVMLYLDCVSRTRSQVASPEVSENGASSSTAAYARQKVGERSPIRLRPLLWRMTSIAVAMPIVAVCVFLVLPRADITVLRHVSLAAKFDLPFIKDGSIINRGLDNRQMRGDGSIRVNPQAYFGFTDDLDLNYRGSLSNEVVMRVNSSSGQFWRAMAFDTFDGTHWTMSKPKHTQDRVATWNSRIMLQPLPSFFINPKHCRQRQLTQTFYIESNQPNLIPVASVPETLYFPGQFVKVDDYGSLRSVREVERDTVYTVDSQIRIFDWTSIRKEPPLDKRRKVKLWLKMANYLQLPESLSTEKIRDLADSITGTGGNWYSDAEKICYYLQNNYKYDIESPAPPEDMDAVTHFLFNAKRGSCEHFASSFVVLCRAHGIPARLVTGFTPGEYNGLTGLWEVRMADAHGWAEVFVPHEGWVTFDPTASGVAPGFSGYDRQSAVDWLAERIKPHIMQFFNQTWMKDAAHSASNTIGPAVQKSLTWLWGIWQPLLIAFGVISVVAFACQWSWLRRRISQKNSGVGASNLNDGRSAECIKLLSGVLTQMEELQVSRRSTETVREFSTRAGEHLLSEEEGVNVALQAARRDLADVLQTFAEDYCATRFSADIGNEELERLQERARKVEDVVKQIVAATSRPSSV